MGKIALLCLAAWVAKTPMPKRHRFLFQDPVVIDSRIVVVRGPSILEYEPERDAWSERAAPLTAGPRAHFAVAAMEGRLYAIGGLQGPERPLSDAIEEFDFASGKWRRRADMPLARRDARAVVWNGKIYVVGGFDRRNQPAPILVYDPKRDAWEQKRTCSGAMCCWSAHVIGDRIYILGSVEKRDNSEVLEVYDPAADTIVRKRAMPWPRVAYGAAAVGGRIYAFGGEFGKLENPVSSIDVYDPERDTWTKFGEMPLAKSWPGVVAIGPRIYVMGGIQDWYKPETAVDTYDIP